MSNGFEYNAPKGINLDISETNPEIYQTGKFIKNLTTAVNINADGNTTQIVGNNESIRTPLVSNELICDIQLPPGDNYAIGSYNDPQSKETYVHVWNSNKGYLTYRINENWECQKVYEGYCLNYNLASENFIPQHRNVFFYKCQTNLFTGKEEYVRYWIFTDGINPQRFISVNDSIKTKSFTQNSTGINPRFRYSNPANTSNSVLFDPCEYIELAPRMPMKCIGISELPNADQTKNNFLINKSWQFRIKFFDVWNRESEHGVISDLYIPASNGCQAKSTSLPRCLELRIEAGSPIVAKIAIEFRNCISTNTDIPIESDWYTYDVIDKYADCGINNEKDWFDRSITLNDYDAPTNTFLYNFCAEKECTPIPVEQTNRTSNPIPILSQSITRLGNGIVLANNQVGYPKVNCDTKELLKVEYEPPVAPCEPKYCDIEFWAVIHNPFVNRNQLIYNVGGSDDKNNGWSGGVWKWGGIGQYVALTGTVPVIKEVDTDYGQTFMGETNNQQNFYAYLEGTDFKVQGFQQLFEGGVLKDYGAPVLNSNSDFKTMARKINNGSYFLQHFVFRNVPLGKYLIRIAGHNNTQDSNYQDSSTYTVGSILKANYGASIIYSDIDTYYKEFEVNTCDYGGSVYTIDNRLVILDLSCPDTTLDAANSHSNVWYGYANDSAGNPTELIPIGIVKVNGVSTLNHLSIIADGTLTSAWTTLKNKTDHNGFWFCAFTNITPIDIPITMKYWVENSACPTLSTKGVEFSDNSNTGSGNASEIPITISEDVTLGVPNYALCKSILITGRITDCDNKPITGMPVIFTRSKSSLTNSNGYFNIIIHNDIDKDTTTVLGRELGSGSDDDKIFISQNGLCVFVDCNSCENCVNISYNADINLELICFSCDGDDKKILTIYSTKVRFPNIGQRGLKHGSINKFGLKLYDNVGRHTFVGTNDNLELYIPKSQQQLSQHFGKIKYTLTPGFVFPSWAKYLGIYWTDQSAAYKYLEFVISSVDININAGKISIGFQSIINYNTDNNFDTNTSWEFLKGDRIEFIADETGNFFDANNPQIGLLNFQIEGNIANNSGVIDYDPRLANLKIGTLIQLQRRKECNNELFYWEVCAPIELISNQIPSDKLTGYLNIWNAYLVSRKIRYSLGGIDSVHSFPFSFEHFAPSDTWGGNCGNRGRVNTVNPYEQQYCKPMSVVLSDSYSTNINGLSRFDEANEHQFDDHGFGSVTGMVTKLNYILFICTKSAFVVQYDDNTLKINSEGRVIYMGQRFSKPSPQNQELGCDASDTATISQLNGIVMFLDRFNCALVIHNFASTADVSQSKFYGYLSSKINTVKDYNNGTVGANKTFEKIFQGLFDPEKNEYILTQFDLPLYDSSGTILGTSATYINEEIDINEIVPETLAFNIDPQAMCMTSFYSFTPENYSLLNNQLVSFKNAKPYNHGISNSGTTFNIFYGLKTLPVFDFVCSTNSPGIVKYFQWLEIYCREQKWYAIKITTENGQLSEIPATYIEKVDNFWTTEFLCDINTFADPTVPLLNTPSGRLIEGDSLIGKWIRIKLIRETTDQEKYFELQSAVVFAIEKSK